MMFSLVDFMCPYLYASALGIKSLILKLKLFFN